MRLTVRRKARRRGQSIAVGAVSQSWPSVGWIGRFASGCADSGVKRGNGTDKTGRRVCSIGQGRESASAISLASICGWALYTYWSKVLRGANADQPEFYVWSG